MKTLSSAKSFTQIFLVHHIEIERKCFNKWEKMKKNLVFLTLIFRKFNTVNTWTALFIWEAKIKLFTCKLDQLLAPTVVKNTYGANLDLMQFWTILFLEATKIFVQQQNYS